MDGYDDGNSVPLNLVMDQGGAGQNFQMVYQNPAPHFHRSQSAAVQGTDPSAAVAVAQQQFLLQQQAALGLGQQNFALQQQQLAGQGQAVFMYNRNFSGVNQCFCSQSCSGPSSSQRVQSVFAQCGSSGSVAQFPSSCDGSVFRAPCSVPSRDMVRTCSNPVFTRLAQIGLGQQAQFGLAQQPQMLGYA